MAKQALTPRFPEGTRVRIVKTRSHVGDVGTIVQIHGEIAGDRLVTVRTEAGQNIRVYDRQIEAIQ